MHRKFIGPATSQPATRRPDVARVLGCVPRRLESELARTLGSGARVTRDLDLRRIAEALQVGEYAAVATDPSVVSPAFLGRLFELVGQSTAFLVIWTRFSKSTIPAILRAGAVCRTEVLYRDVGDSATAFPNWLTGESSRSAVLRTLSPIVGEVEPNLALVVFGVLAGRIVAGSVGQLARQGGFGRRTLERHMLDAGFCHPKPLIHLGRLVTAFECVAELRKSVDGAATAAGYKSPQILWTNARRYVNCSPSDFGKRVSANEFAARIAAAARQQP